MTDPSSDEVYGSASIARTMLPLDRDMLERTLDLAEMGRPAARPNPVVGAVLAGPDGRVLATGFHERFGGPHAERACLDRFGDTIPGDATLYVSLEPCDHHGKQPPCSVHLSERGVRRVVYASCDSNPVTSGSGPARLNAAGIEILRGPIDIERRAVQQNAGFHSMHIRGRPYVTAKWAMTSNGRFTTGDPIDRWVSSAESRGFVQYLRAGSGAILVGVGTALADDPRLTVRGPLARRIATQPIRVVADRQLRLPLDSELVRGASEDVPLIVACSDTATVEAEAALVAAGASVWRAPRCAEPGDPCELTALIARLGELGVHDVLVEAGPTLLRVLHRAQLIDAAIAFVSPRSAPVSEPGLDPDDLLLQCVLAEPGVASGNDQRHVALIEPAWGFPGCVATE